MKIISKMKTKARHLIKSVQEEKAFRKNAAFVKKQGASSSASHKVIVDCGFNRGLVANRLLGKLPDFSLVGFEIQQDIQKYSDELKRRFPNREIDVIYSAVSSRDGLIEYFEPTKWGKNYKGGTTTVRNKNSMEIMYDQPNVAPSVDFAKWLREHISNDHFVFVKMDIEGGEYNVIEHLLNTGAINLINVLAVEWHAEKFPEPMRSKYIDIEKRVKQYAEFNQITVLDWY